MTDTSASKNILQEIASLNFSRTILNKACEIYGWLALKETPRGIHRKKVICYCIFQAPIELEEGIIDTCEIAKVLGMNFNQAKSAVDNRPPLKKGFRPKSPTVSLVATMKSYATDALFLPEDIVTSMEIIFRELLQKNQSLVNEQHKPLVAAFIICYIRHNSMEVDEVKLAETFHLGKSTIQPKYRLVEEAMSKA